jgi:hypothetical protein
MNQLLAAAFIPCSGTIMLAPALQPNGSAASTRRNPMSRVQIVDPNIFTNILGKATQVDIDIPKVGLLEATARKAA